ncbi:hypothetical protein CANARDRAFT_29382 [[Candida] arabinofermentans NRRL YB-2248]|uniref:IMS import disulfide relay-system CHCH-CHCH-like Cx9C domain-containing protein n=1 Tax=[Candida] arabinofermentans NRRL YB-2248 TaxID=983967 RepID=A0A1E4SXJ9_9ASCO|nr:hypothetical protein CANARDRAFT_29382 [[Candida] arabinofermentans NRRL YB-2248]
MPATSLHAKKPTRQVTKLMNATMQCSQQSVLYGQCVLKNYENISKDACMAEFMNYKQCVQKHLGKRW